MVETLVEHPRFCDGRGALRQGRGNGEAPCVLLQRLPDWVRSLMRAARPERPRR